MQALWSANTSVAHCDAGTMDGGVHLITQRSLANKREEDGCLGSSRFFKERKMGVSVLSVGFFDKR